MDPKAAAAFFAKLWDESAIPELQEYIRIPNKSVAFDPEWKAHGHMDKVVERFREMGARARDRGDAPRGGAPWRPHSGAVHGNSRRLGRLVLLYGHMDKQPEMAGWREGLDPWTPVLEDDRLYGRGAADDGYAMFACLSAIGALQGAEASRTRGWS